MDRPARSPSALHALAGTAALAVLACSAALPDYWARRSAHPTQLTRSAPAPNRWEPVGARPGVEAVRYRCAGRELKAYLLRPPEPAPEPAPALVYLHGNFELEAGSFDAVQPFVDAGFVVLLPTYRGEQGNPGRLELLFGEVEDAAAAVRFLAARPGVDVARVHAIGHSVGGAIAALLSVWPDLPLATTASVGGIYVPETFVRWTRMRGNRGLVRFDVGDREELELRVLGPHVHAMHRPHRAYVGEQDHWFIPNARAVERRARRFDQPFEVIMVPGDHMRSLRPALAQHLRWLRARP